LGNKSTVHLSHCQDVFGRMLTLKMAINKDESLKQQAKTDCEFIKYRSDNDFKSLTD